ncbi:hypothetical protein AK812_SmicGene47396 [Symbiodinium microadriaticum]|uniref:Uncharacterized protein n=1 Tax=Symbiodinium microadriaticum TaxID=2951 RepID=A0A1Q9BRX0_SYMMI|nr:hypothetical protein AK812_SmicGene47396 [Symbiodinium microadriaticum]
MVKDMPRNPRGHQPRAIKRPTLTSGWLTCDTTHRSRMEHPAHLAPEPCDLWLLSALAVYYEEEPSQVLELLDCEEVRANLPAADRDMLKEAGKASAAKREEASLLRQVLLDSSKAKRKKGVKRKPVSFAGVTNLSASHGEGFAPPGTKLYRDNFNARWRLWYGAGPLDRRWQKSKSWGATGTDEDCIIFLVKAAWARHEMLHGEPCPFDFPACAFD